MIEFSIPAIVGMLVFALYNIVDRIFIGKGLGAYAMTGLSICFPIFTIYIAIGMLIGQGGGSVLSIKLGEHDSDGAHKALGNTFTLFTISSIVLTILGNIYIDQILTIFGATENTLTYAREYIYVINNLVIFNFLSMGINNLIRSEGNSKLAMNSMIIGAFINIVFDPILIFYFDMGIKGAAYATIFSNIIVSLINLHYFTLSKNSHIKLRVKDLILDLETVKKILSIGISPFSLQLTTSLTSVLCNKMLLSQGGDLAVGAMGIVNSIYLFLGMTMSGISSGSQPILGYNYGAKKHGRVLETLKVSIIAAVGVGSIITITTLLFPNFFINLFNDGNQEILRIGSRGIRIYFLLIPLNCFYIIGANFFQYINNAMKSVVLNLLRQVVLFIPLLFILPKYFGIDGVWMVFPISDVIIFIITGYFLKKYVKNVQTETDFFSYNRN